MGDAADLPFDEETFDFVVGAQVYCYVPDVAHAIREAARVLRKGGRLVVLDSDWEMCIWGSTDLALARRIVAARAAIHFAHPYLPRELHGLIRSAGMRLAEVQAFPIVETHYDPDSYSAGMIEQMRDTALKQHIPAEAVSAWVEDLHARAAKDDWFFCLNRFIFVATK